MGDVIHHAFKGSIRQAPTLVEEGFSFGRPIPQRNEPADRFIDAVQAVNRQGPECERHGRRALFAFNCGTDANGYCINETEIVRAIVHLENLPDDASPIAQHHARIGRLALLAVLKPFPEPRSPECA